MITPPETVPAPTLTYLIAVGLMCGALGDCVHLITTPPRLRRSTPLKSAQVLAGWEAEAATYAADPFMVPPVTTTPAGEVTACGEAQVKVVANLTLTWVAVPVELKPWVTVPDDAVVPTTMVQVISPVAGTLA